MATPMTSKQIVSQLKKWGINYKEHGNWATHNRNHVGSWGPVNGLMVHHTGSDSKDQVNLLYHGRSDLPGPLCHFGLDQKGVIHLIGWGRANHAGKGDNDVLQAVISESYKTYPPVDNQANVDGNPRFYGVEIWYSGNHDMTEEQIFTLNRLGAAICDFHGWTAKSVIGHGEWQPGKWDPGIKPGKMRDMAIVRSDIAEAIKRGPNKVSKDMWDELFDTDRAPAPSKSPTKKTNKTWKLVNMFREIWDRVYTTQSNVEKNQALLIEIRDLLKQQK